MAAAAARPLAFTSEDYASRTAHDVDKRLKRASKASSWLRFGWLLASPAFAMACSSLCEGDVGNDVDNGPDKEAQHGGGQAAGVSASSTRSKARAEIRTPAPNAMTEATIR